MGVEELGVFSSMDPEALAKQLPHPDDPALGIVISNLVAEGFFVNLDDRDFNVFSLNPSCNSTFSSLHGRTWVVHHATAPILRCMWALDVAGRDQLGLPDLCPCAANVSEDDEDPMYDGNPFWYPRNRFSVVAESL